MYKTAEITAHQVLLELLQDSLPEVQRSWFDANIGSKNRDELGNQFISLFSLIPRHITPDLPEYKPETQSRLEKLYPGFAASEWNNQQLSRVFLMVNLPLERNENLLKLIFETADIKELITLYKGLYFLDNAEDFTLRMQEGVRTNMTDVFEAIALHNPYAYLYLPEDAWNQLVLKAVFTARPLFRIYGLDLRANEKLAFMLHGYIHERWSAGRAVTPEIWRGIEGFVDEVIETDLYKVMQTGTPLEQEVAAKVLESNGRGWNEIGADYEALIKNT
jgi:hypothetical protein